MARDVKNNQKFRERPPRLDLHPDTKKGVWALLFFGVAVILGLSIVDLAGPAGNLLSGLMQSLFGWGHYAVPLILLGAAAVFFSSARKHLYFTTLLGSLILIAALLGLFELSSGENVHHGGYLGLLLTYPFQTFLGVWASGVIFILGFIVGLLITFNIPLSLRRREKEAPEPRPAEDIKIRTVAAPAETPLPGRIAGIMTRIFPQPRFKEREINAEGEGKEREAGKPREPEFAIASAAPGQTYAPPPLELLEADHGSPSSGDIKANANIIRRTLENFAIVVEMGEVNVGPTVTQYTLKPAEGVKLSRIVALQNDLALALAAHPIRIEAPIPGRSLVGIEIPNRAVTLVRLQNLLAEEAFRESPSPLALALGRDVAGNPVFADLARMPHLLIAGATGTGKSVAIHGLLMALLYRNPPQLLKILLIDPKRVELPVYNGIPHLLTPVITDGKKAIHALRWAVQEMERRYGVLEEAKARDIASYNIKVKGGKSGDPLPYLIIVIDELADLMAAYARDVEASIVRLSQMARAVGIHLVVSTQRPSIEVITGLIKANITSRVAFQVASQVDSRTILDMAGAEKLLGNGDMLYLAGDAGKPRRIQGEYVSEKEVHRVVDFLTKQLEVEATAEEAQEEERLEEALEGKSLVDEILNGGGEGYDDELYPDAKALVVEAGKASASLLQRRLRVGYARAARLLDILEANRVIGPGEGAKPREVLIRKEEA
ncbi:DNA translocase FtsK 4TM domain-containing protein [Candidatus Azambacteria bacterium]|nr:DNA translocase FtsK 4TM domain-containing protein [Candidatus Azambacteria bacterium]